ncbi:MAG TPA: hypothetical protein VFY40_10645 [Blastocatellia bacterium]|nr:hypothetical protein [Blastocatellia bacterium]
MRQQTVKKASGRGPFEKAFRRALSNAFWFGAGATVIALTSNVSWKMAVGLFTIYLLYLIVIGIDALLVLTRALLPMLLTIPLDILYRRAPMAEEVWLLLGAVARIIAAGVGLAFGWHLYQRLF